MRTVSKHDAYEIAYGKEKGKWACIGLIEKAFNTDTAYIMRNNETGEKVMLKEIKAPIPSSRRQHK